MPKLNKKKIKKINIETESAENKKDEMVEEKEKKIEEVINDEEVISEEELAEEEIKIPEQKKSFFNRYSDKEKRFLVFFIIFVLVMFTSGAVLFSQVFTLKSRGTAKKVPIDKEILDDGRIIAPPLEAIEEPVEEAIEEPVEEVIEEEPPSDGNDEEKEVVTPEIDDAVAGYMNSIRKRSEIYFPEIRNMDLEWKLGGEERITIKSMRYSIKRTKLNPDKLSIEELFVKDYYIRNLLNSATIANSQVMAFQKNDMVCLYNKSASMDIVTHVPIEDRYDLFLSCGVLPEDIN